MRVSVSARTGPGPETARLCRVSTMSELVCARSAGEKSSRPPRTAPRAMPAFTVSKCASGCRLPIALGDSEDLHAPVVGIANVELAAGAEKQPGRQPELAEIRAAPAEGQQEGSAAIEELHVVENRVGDIDHAVAVDRHPLRHRQVARAAAVLAEPAERA